MTRAFGGSGAVFAASYSGTGPARRRFWEAIRRRARLVISPLTLDEWRRNLASRATAGSYSSILTAHRLLALLERQPPRQA
jgi:hypothetical protein